MTVSACRLTYRTMSSFHADGSDVANADFIIQANVSHSLSEQGSSRCRFKVHRARLAAASTFFEGMFSASRCVEEDHSNLPVVQVDDAPCVWEAMLAVIYEKDCTTLLKTKTIRELAAIYEAGLKYDIMHWAAVVEPWL